VLNWSLWVANRPWGGARIYLQGRVGNQLDRPAGGGVNGDDLIVVAVDDQGRHVDPLEVFGEVGLGEGLDAVVGALDADLHAPQPERTPNPLGDGRAGPVGAVEGRTHASPLSEVPGAASVLGQEPRTVYTVCAVEPFSLV
jgi:hypothetical protein